MSEAKLTRRKARQCALQALYQWQVTGGTIADVEQQFRHFQDTSGADLRYFHDIFTGACQNVQALDALLKQHLDRALKDLDPVELSLLRLGAYELVHRSDVPYKVVINEALELEKTFGATDGHRYINGVLDKIAKQVRVAEFKKIEGT